MRPVKAAGRAGLLLMTLTLAACNTVTEQDTRRDHEAIGQRAEQANALLRANPGSSPTLIEEHLPRFARRSIPLDRSRVLPPGLGLITLQLPGRYNLRTVALHIERLTRIPVVLSADAVVPVAEFTPAILAARATRAASPAASAGAETPVQQTEAAAQSARPAALLVEQAGAGPQWSQQTSPDDLYEINHRGTLGALLDSVANQGQLQWAFEQGRIRFYRLVHRQLAIKTLPSNLSQSISLILPGSGSNSLSSTMESNFWQAIEKGVRELLSVSGSLVIDSSLGTLLVTDSFQNVAAVERYVETVNRQLSRQVSLTVEVLQVQLSGENQAGIDWSFVRRVAGLGNLSAESAPTLTSNTGTVSLVKPSASGSDNLFFIRALERFGRVSSAYSSVVTTMNRQPVPLGSLSTQSYLKQVSPTVVTTATGGTVYGAPSLTPGEVTTGFSMSLLPVVLDSNEIMLQSTISISSLREMATFTSGSGLAQQTIQTPNTASFATQQRMSVRSGDTIVLSGLESEAAETKENDVVRQAVPVSRRNTREKSTVVILITPRLLEN